MRYAAYGSNLHPERLRARTPSARLLGAAPLPGWTLRFHKRSKDGSGKCMIANGGSGIHVAIYEIDTPDKQSLDRIEGLGLGYNEVIIDVPEFGACASYVADPAYIDGTLNVYDWYRELVLLGARFHSFPDAYMRELAATPAIEDPEPERRDRNWAIVSTIAPDMD